MIMTAPKIDKPSMIERLLYIDDKRGIVRPFKFNRGQLYFNKNKSNRNIILKHRQGGWSSGILADMYTDCITVPHTTCAVVSHETRATQRLLDRVQFYYDTMESPKPEIGAESRSEKTFPGMHSSIYIGTAGSRAFGRGDTIRKALLSELPFYEDGEKILNGVEDAVPITGELTIEGTPNGEDNIFFEAWTRAREGKSPFKPFFFPWWWTNDYQIPRDSDYALPEDRWELTFTGEEIDLVERFHLTEAQIRWRRWKIGEKGGLFWQEYPEDEVSCFLTIGDPVFDQFILTTLAQGSYEGEHHEQGWTFWIPPQEKMNYVIGVDTSAGVPGGSYSAAVVLDDLWQVCATFQARIEPYAFAAILKEMGKWYNKAEIAVERNFTGYAVLGHMLDYSNIYMQRDFVTGKITSQRGWWTNDQTKSYMMTKLKDSLPRLKLWDVNLVRQMRGYRYIKFKPTAQTFDDLVIALMIANAVKAVQGVARGYQGKVPSWNW
jgi:hypothetical protein